jgi:hypothetical protein
MDCGRMGFEDMLLHNTFGTRQDVILGESSVLHNGSFFYTCGSVHHQSILLNNQRDAALSSCIYSSLQGYSTCFGCFLRQSSGVQLKLQMQP